MEKIKQFVPKCSITYIMKTKMGNETFLLFVREALTDEILLESDGQDTHLSESESNFNVIYIANNVISQKRDCLPPFLFDCILPLSCEKH